MTGEELRTQNKLLCYKLSQAVGTIAELEAELARVRQERDKMEQALKRLRAFPSVRLSGPLMDVILDALPELAAPGGPIDG